jgi:pSer/pThr/pTyr-binding forkhead associated (FHA) protein
MEVTSVLKDILTPYQGKVISLKCSNPACGKPMKVQVPELSKTEVINIQNISEYPPTQILKQDMRRLKSAKIRILKSDKTEEQVFDLKNGINTIGRFSLTDKISLPDIPIFTLDKLISRKCHCEIVVQKKGELLEAIIRDSKSKNGTFLPGSEKPLSQDDEIFLKDKDIFIIGETKIQIELG